MAASQIVTKGARRRANGLLELTAAARQSNMLPLSPDAWSHLGAPLRQSSASALRDYLLNAMPDFVRPLQVIEHMHILSVARICHWEWNAAQQALYAQIQMGEQDLSET